MATRYTRIAPRLQDFIKAQRLFFVAAAAADGPINLSPKGMDSLRVLDPNRVLWLNLTGSGNETAAHLSRDSRMTLMFCAFREPPMILRLYGQARAVHADHADRASLLAHFPDLPGARQVIDMRVELAQTSCGFGVPLYEHIEDRNMLTNWARKKGGQGIRDYWHDKNQFSLNGLPTGIPLDSETE